MSIAREQKMANKYLLKRTQNGLLEISLENVAKAEAMIQSDSRYNLAKVENNIKQLKPLIRNNQLQSSAKLPNIFMSVVSSINISNSTRMSHAEEQSMVDFLITNQSTLIKRLYKRDFCLVCQLTTCASRKNYAFATKFCHYMCYYLFNGQKQQDNFSIYDNVVAGVLGEYAKQYGIYKSNNSPYWQKDFNNFKQYATYSEVIDRIRAAVSGHISRNGFDHLLWYANK